MSPPRRAAETTEALRASLVDHARRIVERDGAAALTMRSLATEAGCAVGLPYKVFLDRQDLVVAILGAEFARITAAAAEFTARAGTASVGANLTWFSELILDSPAVALAEEVVAHEDLSKRMTAHVRETGAGPAAFEGAFAAYLVAEKRQGRVDADVDERAFAFLLAGAVHNLVMSGEAWPRPTRRQLRRWLDAVANAIAPRS
ncbi:MAG TPA: TetR/AcrR family transcriptional regulator [Acidimicrobiales bacterium]|nr:TetR/AcrR family transcriptional regulator [Acidimicrobiales bacterium]